VSGHDGFSQEQIDLVREDIESMLETYVGAHIQRKIYQVGSAVIGVVWSHTGIDIWKGTAAERARVVKGERHTDPWCAYLDDLDNNYLECVGLLAKEAEGVAEPMLDFLSPLKALALSAEGDTEKEGEKISSELPRSEV